MDSQDKTIAIIGTSYIIKYGIACLIRENLGLYKILKLKDFNSLQALPESQYPAVIMLDAGIIDSNMKLIHTLKKESPNTVWIGYQYQYVTPSSFQVCDEIITIDQSIEEIVTLINKNISLQKAVQEESKGENLSDRETDVLKLLVTGYSSKEIADRLNISINTVISHRKNISQKTGIKSLAGLTIYAVTKKVITMSSLQKQ